MRWQARTESVLSAVLQEREAQVARYGHNHDLADGTGQDVMWLLPLAWQPADVIEQVLRDDYEDFEQATGLPTWMHLIREEVAEAFKESDPERLEAELIQVAALCVSWVETLQERRGAPVPSGLTIEDLDLTVRATNALRRWGIETVDQLCELTLSDLYGIRNIGFGAVDEIRARLEIEGRSLKSNDSVTVSA